MTTERGDGWEMHLGDAFAVMATLVGFDHVITDPPYLGARGASWEATRVPLAVPYEPASAKTLRDLSWDAARLARQWVLVFNDYVGDIVLREALGECKMVVAPAPISWVKPPGAFTPNGSANSPAKQVEFITAARKPRLKARRALPGAYVSPSYSPRQEIFRTGGKPLSLMLEIVGDFTDPGESVLDPFAGAGTTGLACVRMGRPFTGIERDPECFALAVERLRAETEANRLPLIGGVK